jgi:hypothetical protein
MAVLTVPGLTLEVGRYNPPGVEPVDGELSLRARDKHGVMILVSFIFHFDSQSNIHEQIL